MGVRRVVLGIIETAQEFFCRKTSSYKGYFKGFLLYSSSSIWRFRWQK